MSDDLRGLLQEAGRRAVPPVTGAFADELETRLLAVASSLAVAAPEPPTPASGLPGPAAPDRGARGPGRGGSPRWRLAGLGAVLALAVLAVLLGQVGRAPEVTSIPIAALDRPVHVEVVLPGGEVLEDPDGLLLPAGAIIRVGEGGSAWIGDTALAPGDVATVGAERVTVTRGGSKASPAMPDPGGTPRAGTTAGRSASPSPSPAAGAPTPSPTRSPGSPSAPAPASPAPSAEGTVAPTRAPTARPAPSATPAPTPSPSPTPPILRPRLRARLIDGPRIAVTWTETRRAASYVLIASLSRGGPAPDPVYPGSRILGEFATPPENRLRYRVPAGVVEVRLQVLALRSNGSVLRRSRVVTIEIPQASTSPSGDLAGASASLDPVPGASPDPGASSGP